MTIKRFPGGARGRSAAVTHNGLVYAVATDIEESASVAEQTRKTLERLGAILAEAGSGKSGILQATVYLRDMSSKADQTRVPACWFSLASAKARTNRASCFSTPYP